MPYRLSCPACKTNYLIPDDSLGKPLQCTKCGQAFLAGNAKSASPSEAKPAAADRAKPAANPPRPLAKRPHHRESFEPAATPAVPATQSPPAEAKKPPRREILKPAAAPSVAATQPKEKPRWRIRALVAVLLVLGGFGAGVAVTVRYFRAHQEAVPVIHTTLAQGVHGGAGSPSAEKAAPAAESNAVAVAASKNSAEPTPSADQTDTPIEAPPQPSALVTQQPPDPPVADRAELPRAAEIGKPFKYQLVHPTQKVRSYTLHSGPKGLKMSKEGLIDWTPSPGQGGTHRLLVGVVTDKMSGANIYTIRVNEAGFSTSAILPADLDLVPGKQTVFLSVRPAELWKDPALAPLRRSAETNKTIADGLARLKQGTGLDPGDIQRAVIVFWGKQHDPNSVVLVTTVKPFDRPRILRMIGEGQREETINGKSVISSPKSEFALHLLNERTFLYGRAPEVKKLLEHPARDTRSSGWNNILRSATQHALYAGIQSDIFAEDPKSQTPPPLKVLNPLLDAQTATASLDAGRELRLTVRFTFARDDQATGAEAAARQAVSVASTFLNQFAGQFKKNMPGQLPPPLAKLVSAAQDAEASMKKATIQVKDRTLECQVTMQSADWPEAVAAAAALFLAPRPTRPSAGPGAPPPISRKVQAPKTPEEAEAAITKLGGKVDRNESEPGKPITHVEFENVKVTDDDLVVLRPIGTLIKLSLWNNKEISDKGMEYLAANCPRLRRLTLVKNRITNAGLAHLSKLENLDSLNVSKCPITDKGLMHLKALKKLEFLTLSELSDVTDAGLVHLKDLVNLTHLDLSYCRITDKGLVQLKTLKNLEDLTLNGNDAITNNGVAELKKALPKVDIAK